MQGLIEHYKEIVEYFNRKGVSVIFLFRKNLLRRMVSVLSNSHDRYAKLLNGTHKSHVHSHEEVSSCILPSLSLHAYTDEHKIIQSNHFAALPRLVLLRSINQKSIQHCWSQIWKEWRFLPRRHWTTSIALDIWFCIMKILSEIKL